VETINPKTAANENGALLAERTLRSARQWMTAFKQPPSRPQRQQLGRSQTGTWWGLRRIVQGVY